MSKFAVTCTITYEPERVYEWAAELELKKRTDISIAVNHNDLTRHNTVAPSGGVRTCWPSSPKRMDEVVRTMLSGGAPIPETPKDTDADTGGWKIRRLGEWLSRPFPAAIEVFEQPDVDVTLITDLMHFTVEQAKDLDETFSSRIPRLGDRGRLWNLILNRISQFCSFNDTVEKERAGYYRCKFGGLPRIHMRSEPNESSITDNEIALNQVVKVSAIVTGSGVEYLRLADNSGYFPVVVGDLDAGTTALFDRLETYRCIAKDGVPFLWVMPEDRDKQLTPHFFLDRPELSYEQSCLVDALIADHGTHGIPPEFVTKDDIRKTMSKHDELDSPVWFVDDQLYRLETDEKDGNHKYRLPEKIGEKYVVAVPLNEGIKDLCSQRSGGVPDSSDSVGVSSCRSGANLWDLVRNLVRFPKGEKLVCCQLITGSMGIEYIPRATMYPGYYRLVLNGVPAFEKFDYVTNTYLQYDIQSRKWLAPSRFKIGDRVKAFDGRTSGTVRFVGYQKCVGPRVGVHLDSAEGNHNGTVAGHKYFGCPNNHGIMVESHVLTPCGSQLDVNHVQFHHDGTEDTSIHALPPAMKRPSRFNVTAAKIEAPPDHLDSSSSGEALEVRVVEKAQVHGAALDKNQPQLSDISDVDRSTSSVSGRFRIKQHPNTPVAKPNNNELDPSLSAVLSESRSLSGVSRRSEPSSHPGGSVANDQKGRFRVHRVPTTPSQPLQRPVEEKSRAKKRIQFAEQVSRLLQNRFPQAELLYDILAEEFDNPEELRLLTNAQTSNLDRILKIRGLGIRSRAVVSQICARKKPWPKLMLYMVRQCFVDHFNARLKSVLEELKVDPQSLTWDDGDVPGSSKRVLQADFTVRFEEQQSDLNLNFTAAKLSMLSKEFLKLEKHIFLLLRGGVGTTFTAKPVDTSYEQVNLDKAISRKFRLSFAEINTKIRLGAVLNFDFIVFTFAAAIIAAVGLGRDDVVSTVASMLISPLMGPIMGMTFGGVIKDNRLLYTSLQNELLGLSICIFVGLIAGLVFSQRAIDYDWPTESMEGRGEPMSLLIGIAIAIPSGLGVALSITAANTSGLVGVAISASLLPPAVNAGMCWGLAIASPDTPKSDRSELAQTGLYSLLLTVVNILCIIIVATTAFRFRTIMPTAQEELREFTKTLLATRHATKGEAHQFQEMLQQTRKSYFSRWFGYRRKAQSDPSNIKASADVKLGFVPPLRLVFRGVVIGSDKIKQAKASKTVTGFNLSSDEDSSGSVFLDSETEEQFKVRELDSIIATINLCACAINHAHGTEFEFGADDVQIEETSAIDKTLSKETLPKSFNNRSQINQQVALDLKRTTLGEGKRMVDKHVLIYNSSVSLEYMQDLVRELENREPTIATWPYGRVKPKITFVEHGASGDGNNLFDGLFPKILTKSAPQSFNRSRSMRRREVAKTRSTTV